MIHMETAAISGSSAIDAPLRSVRPLAEKVAVASRWLLGAVFVYMGFNKVMDPVGFLKLVEQYHFVGQPVLLNLIAAVLPWFEIFCGLLLLTGIGVRGAALLLIAMLVPFTILVALRAHALATAAGTSLWAVKFDCGCGTGEVLIWHKLIENPLMILLAGWLAFSGLGKRLSVRYALFS